MAQRHPMQASGRACGNNDGEENPDLGGGSGAGESGGGAYPNAAEHESGSQGGSVGHGGYSDIA